jgi:hypothetical protein
MIEHLPSQPQALSSNPSITKEKFLILRQSSEFFPLLFTLPLPGYVICLHLNFFTYKMTIELCED